ncbi:MAG: YidH family protein [Steroidobacteraceae bacterium]
MAKEHEPEQPEPEQITLMKRLVEMSRERSQMSSERTFMNAERTLSVWIRTALGLMVFGIAVDRFGLILRQLPAAQAQGHITKDALSTWGGGALIALGVLMAVSTGVRFALYAAAYRRVWRQPLRHGPYLGPIFAALVALFGVGLLVIVSVFTT